MYEIPTAAQLDALPTLKKSPRMPVLFVGHGSPMNAIEDNLYRQSWQAMGAELLAREQAPQLILCISAHWLTQGWWLTGTAQPRTLHDFGGFPQALFDQQYPAPGAPEAARLMSLLVRQRGSMPLGLENGQWGLDHGTWSVLKPMFPLATIPVIQLSMDYSRSPHEHFALAQQLKALRHRGVLIVASGNMVHNLHALRMGSGRDQTYDWAREFDSVVAENIGQGRLKNLPDFMKMGEVAKMAHPSHEHFLPLLYAAASVEPSEETRFFSEGFQAASISMRSVAWGM